MSQLQRAMLQARGADCCPPNTDLPDLTSHLSAEDSETPSAAPAEMPETNQPQLVDRVRFQKDPSYRFAHLADFIGVTPDHFEILSKHSNLVDIVTAALVKDTYVLLESYDITRDALVSKRPAGNIRDPENQAPLEAANLVTMRKERLGNYLDKMVSWPQQTFNQMWRFLDHISDIHVKFVKVGYEHHAALLAALLCKATTMICDVPEITLPVNEKGRLINALTRIFWLQNDSMVRRYFSSVQQEAEAVSSPASSPTSSDQMGDENDI